MKKALFGLVAAGLLLTLAASGSQAGAKNGSNRWSVRVPAKGTATYNIRFVGGQLAEMAIIGDGTTDVDIVVFDAQGQVVVADLGPSDKGLVTWRPPFTQNYRVVVVNLGGVWNDVWIGHN